MFEIKGATEPSGPAKSAREPDGASIGSSLQRLLDAHLLEHPVLRHGRDLLGDAAPPLAAFA